jgi:hypothetical protein
MERFFLVNRLGVPYEGMHGTEPVFNAHGYNRPTTRTRIYKTVRRAQIEADRIANLCQEAVSVRRIAPSGAVTGINGEAA